MRAGCSWRRRWCRRGLLERLCRRVLVDGARLAGLAGGLLAWAESLAQVQGVVRRVTHSYGCKLDWSAFLTGDPPRKGFTGRELGRAA